MKRTGAMLKKAREQKGLSVHEIGLSLKINSKILSAIEDGDMNQLPAKTFLRGFVQSYAGYLRMDLNEVMAIFQEEMGSTRPSTLLQMPEPQDIELIATPAESSQNPQPQAPPQKTSSSESTLAKMSKNNNRRTVAFTLFGLGLVALIIFTKKMIDKYQKESTVSEVEVTTPLEPSPTPKSSPSPTASAAGMSVAVSSPTPTPEVKPTSTPEEKPSPTLKPTATPKPSPSPTPTVTPSPSPSPSPSPTATPEASPSPSPSPSPAAASNKPVEVIVEALDNVDIEFSSRDGSSEKLSLTAEQVHTFKSKKGVRLNISNGGAVNVIVNGKDLGIPGNLGKPVKLNY